MQSYDEISEARRTQRQWSTNFPEINVSPLLSDNELLEHLNSRFDTEYQSLRATTGPPSNPRGTYSSEIFAPSSSIPRPSAHLNERYDVGALTYTEIELPNDRLQGSWTSLEPGGQSLSQASSSSSNADPTSTSNNAAHIGSLVTRGPQQPPYETPARAHTQAQLSDLANAASSRQPLGTITLSSPLGGASSSSVNVSNRPIESLGSNRTNSTKRKRDYVERIFDSRPSEHDEERQVKRGRRGPLSGETKERQKKVKDKRGACWRCRILKKPCDDEEKCSNCESNKSRTSVWASLGCRRGPLVDFVKEELDKREASEYADNFFKDIDRLQDELSWISRSKPPDLDDTTHVRLIAVTNMLGIFRLHVMKALGGDISDSAVQFIRDFACHNNNHCREIMLTCDSCPPEYDKLLSLNNYGSDRSKRDDLFLLAYACISLERIFGLLHHWKLHLHGQTKQGTGWEVVYACEDAKTSILVSLFSTLEPFIFRKNRSDLQYFRSWFLAISFLESGTMFYPLGLLSELFIASTQGVLNSSQSQYEEKRDMIRKVLTHFTSNMEFDARGHPKQLDARGHAKHQPGFEFVAQMAGLSPYDEVKDRTILKSSILSHLPEETQVTLKYFKYWDNPLR